MNQEEYLQAIGRYAIGVVGSVGLTLLAYFSITENIGISMMMLSALILILALIQFGLQLYTFLHFGAEKTPRLRRYSLLFTSLMVIIVTVGSIWIMMNLNYRMNMDPSQMMQYMINQNKKGF